MAKLVEIPDVGMVEFPDDMSDEAIGSTIENDIVPSYSQKSPAQKPATLSRATPTLTRPSPELPTQAPTAQKPLPPNTLQAPVNERGDSMNLRRNPVVQEPVLDQEEPLPTVRASPPIAPELPAPKTIERTFDSSKSVAAQRPKPSTATPKQIEASPVKPLSDLPIVSAGLQEERPPTKATSATEDYVKAAIPANIFGGKPFTVVDKKEGVATVFDSSGKPIRSMTAMTGRRVGDKVIEDGQSYRTPSGVFDAEFYNSEDYGPAVRFARYGSNNMLAHEYAKHSKTNPGTKRLEALKSKDTKALRGSSGCVNLLPEDAKWLSGFAKSNKMKWVVLPETEEGYQTHPSFQALKDRTDGGIASK